MKEKELMVKLAEAIANAKQAVGRLLRKTTVYVSYYLGSKRLGGAYVPEGSEGHERVSAARRKGIMHYNRIVFEGRRLAYYDPQKGKVVIDHHGFKTNECKK